MAATAAWASVPSDYVSGQNFLFQAVVTPAPGDVWADRVPLGDRRRSDRVPDARGAFNGTRFTLVPTPDRDGPCGRHAPRGRRGRQRRISGPWAPPPRPESPRRPSSSIGTGRLGRSIVPTPDQELGDMVEGSRR